MFIRPTVRHICRGFSNVARSRMPKPEAFDKPPPRLSEQMEYIKSIMSKQTFENWPKYRSNILTKQGEANEKNINAIMLKLLIRNKNFDLARVFVKTLKRSNEELSLGTTNTILRFYFELGKENLLTKSEKAFIRRTHTDLYRKYKILDSSTSEVLVNALSIIGDWENGLKVLEDLRISSSPTHQNYGALTSALFRDDKKEEAIQLISKCLQDEKNLNVYIFKAWTDYVLKMAGNDRNKLLSGMEEINKFISDKCLRITESCASIIKSVFVEELNWNCTDSVKVTERGKCLNCKRTLQQVQLTDEEFSLLQSNFKDQVLIGRDVFLKTSPEELAKFMKFLEQTGPYDVVMDVLNIFYSFTGPTKLRIKFFILMVKSFMENDKKILLLGREHMMRTFPKADMAFLQRNTVCFFTDNLSSDDPFFLTAALFNGNETDIVTRDKLRGHRFLLSSERLRNIFLRWQWQHQWHYYVTYQGVPNIVMPLKFTPVAQRDVGWHIPYESDKTQNVDPMNAESPVPSKWLCLRPNKSYK